VHRVVRVSDGVDPGLRALSKRAGSTVAEVKGSHAVYVSQSRAVADLIAKAANAVAVARR